MDAAYVGGMDEPLSYQICARRNVAAAFEHFHSRPAWLRRATYVYCDASDAFGRLARSASSACSSIGFTSLKRMRAVAAHERG